MSRHHILPSDLDPRGNVVVHDHGPQEPERREAESDEDFEKRHAAAAADAKVWHKEHPVVPVQTVMHSSDAGHAMMVEPSRYAMEPHDMQESAIEERVKEIQDRRDAARHAPFAAADRKQAIAELMSERAAVEDETGDE